MTLVGACIQSHRKAAGLSQRGLAERMCVISGQPTVTRHEISRWETGRRMPSRFWFLWLVKALDAPTHELETLWALTVELKRAKRYKPKEPLAIPPVPLPSVEVYNLEDCSVCVIRKRGISSGHLAASA